MDSMPTQERRGSESSESLAGDVAITENDLKELFSLRHDITENKTDGQPLGADELRRIEDRRSRLQKKLELLRQSTTSGAHGGGKTVLMPDTTSKIVLRRIRKQLESIHAEQQHSGGLSVGPAHEQQTLQLISNLCDGALDMESSLNLNYVTANVRDKETLWKAEELVDRVGVASPAFRRLKETLIV